MPTEPTDLVDTVMREQPATIRVFLTHRMLCVGCPVGCFHTVADACREHGVECAAFLDALEQVATRRRGGVRFAGKCPSRRSPPARKADADRE